MGRHGGGAFSGKDPSKVDRSSAYFCRYVAKQVVSAGFAKKAEIQVGYAIGMAKPVSVKVDTFGTGDERAAAEFVMNNFDFRPRAIIEKLNLLRPIYRQSTNYGHFGRPGLPWETVEKAAEDVKEALKGDDAGAITAKSNALMQSSMKLGEAMYKQAQETGAGGAGPGAGPGQAGGTKEDVVDAEFTEVDDDKKNKKSA